MEFLRYVAQDILKRYGKDMSRLSVVFPNKRASLFLDNHLLDLSSTPIWSPHYITISELFESQSERQVADPIKSICDLHKCFLECTGMDESLDQFYGWGQLLLADFDDVDKNLAAPHQVFANVSDLHAFDTVDFLTKEQRDSLKQFFKCLSDTHDTLLKERFLKLWNQLGNIYDLFNRTMASQGLGYEGAIQREVVEKGVHDLTYDHYLFVGFHVLSGTEKKLFNIVKSEGKAHFYWDFDNYYMKGELRESDPGYYLKQQLTLFPNELDNEDAALYDNFRREKEITFVSAPSQDIQARYVAPWLDSIPTPSTRPDTAIVLCDETLLPSVVHSLPTTVGEVNITSGLPLRQSPVYSFLMRLIQLQTIGHPRDTDKYRLFYLKSVLLHPLATLFSEEAPQLLQRLLQARRYYPRREELSDDERLSILFTDVENNAGDASTYSPSRQMLSYLLSVTKQLGKIVNDNEPNTSDPFLSESVYRIYTILVRLAGLMDSGDLKIDLVTLQRLLTQVVDSTTVPFHGEPAVGVQVMGVLETRNLDFQNLLILSCNEKNMPKVSGSSSFIPYAVRKGYGLTTPDHQSNIYSYYFHRMLQRAQHITMVYCNVPDSTHSGEMSRFMMQMLVDGSHEIKRKTLKTEIKPLSYRPSEIIKDKVVVETLCKRFTTDEKQALSPTAINRYLRCPLIFYYNYLGNLKEPTDTLDEGVDNMMFGTLFHKAAEIMYRQKMPNGYNVRKSDVEYVLKHPEIIEQCVDEAFNEEYFNVKSSKQGKPEYNGLQLLNRSVIIKYLTRLMEIDEGLAPFTIKDLEKAVYDELTLFAGTDSEHRLKYGGVIDRWDQIDKDGTSYMRVLDYKTGSKKLTPLPDLEAIFSQDYIAKHSDYYLQTFLYGMIVSKWHNEKHLKIRPALLFIQKATGDDYDPVLKFGKETIDDVAVYREDYMERLLGVVEEIFNPDEPFKPTQDETRCSTCAYRHLCY